MAGRGKRAFSARFSAGVVDALEQRSAVVGQTKSQLAERLIDEGLRTDEFPGVMFRSGPTGRRAGLVGGPDIWEIVRDINGAKAEGADDPLKQVSDVTGLPLNGVRLAFSYYISYPEDVDQRILLAEERAARMQRALGAASVA